MIDAFKTLTQEMMKILEDQMLERDREKSQALSRSLRLNQTEEWLLTGLTDKAEHLFHHVRFFKVIKFTFYKKLFIGS